jgi:hypothetical protein
MAEQPRSVRHNQKTLRSIQKYSPDLRSGFKTSDQAQEPRQLTGFHIFFYEKHGVQQAFRGMKTESATHSGG